MQDDYAVSSLPTQPPTLSGEKETWLNSFKAQKTSFK